MEAALGGGCSLLWVLGNSTYHPACGHTGVPCKSLSKGALHFIWIFWLLRMSGLSAMTGGCHRSSHSRRWATVLFSGKHYEFLKP